MAWANYAANKFIHVKGALIPIHSFVYENMPIFTLTSRRLYSLQQLLTICHSYCV